MFLYNNYCNLHVSKSNFITTWNQMNIKSISDMETENAILTPMALPTDFACDKQKLFK